MKIRKHKCCECGKTAIWKDIKPKKGSAIFFCDECVPREPHPMALDDFGEPSDISNDDVIWWNYGSYGNDFKKMGSKERTKESFYYEFVDGNGKRYPTLNFSMDENGYDMKDIKKFLNYNVISKVVSECITKHFMTARDNFRIKDMMAELFVLARTKNAKPQLVEYNRFMSKLGDKICSICEENSFNGKEMDLITFYRHFKEEIKKYKISE